ncbi:MAG: FtsX-like permease family protein [Peptococcaceae bacterium]|nr:FtsX-like permease family protein [Peptococcaceae bacterium]
MTLGKFLILLGMSMRTSRKRLLLNLFMLTVALVFLFAIALSYEGIIGSVDSALNKAEDMVVYRTFIFKGDIERISDAPEISEIQVLDKDDGEYKIIVADYKRLENFVEKIYTNRLGSVTVDGDDIMKLEAIIKVRQVIQAILVLIFVGTVGTLYVLVRKLIQDRWYEISLYKSVGYRQAHLLPLIWAEVIVLLLAGSAVAIGGGWAIYLLVNKKWSELMAQGLFDYGETGSIGGSIGLVTLIIVLLATISAWNIRGEIKKINAREIRN